MFLCEQKSLSEQVWCVIRTFLRERFFAFFFRKDAEKKVLNTKKLGWVLVSLFVVLILGILFSGEENSSRLEVSFQGSYPNPKPLLKKLPISEREPEPYPEKAPKSIPPRPVKRVSPPLKYKAKQVIIREGTRPSIPLGTYFTGRLITRIDTRAKKHWVKAILPQGARFRDKARLPKGTILIGQAVYSGRGNRVFVPFSQGVLPNGQEFPIGAHALSIEDRGFGMKGEYHSGNMGKLAATLGLNMAGGMAEALTEKEALGEFGVVTPKANMENAFYHGLSQVADMEIERRSRELSAVKPYVIVPAGKGFVVGLTASLKGDFLSHE